MKTSPPDGYTILLAPSDYTLVPNLQAKPAYDPLKDFAPVGMVVDYSHVLVASPNAALNNVKELIAWRRPIRASSTSPPAAMAAPTTCRARCSTRPRA